MCKMRNLTENIRVAAIKYERAPQQGASVPMTDRNGNPLLADYMPCGMRCDYFA